MVQKANLLALREFLGGRWHTPTVGATQNPPTEKPGLGDRIAFLVPATLHPDGMLHGSVMSYVTHKPCSCVVNMNIAYRRIDEDPLTFEAVLTEETQVKGNLDKFEQYHAGRMSDTHGSWVAFEPDGKKQRFVPGSKVQYATTAGGVTTPLRGGLTWMNRDGNLLKRGEF